MKLLVIVICLLSERFLVHSFSHKRFSWFDSYFKWLATRLTPNRLFTNSWVLMLAVILPLMALAFLIWFFLRDFAFGLAGFIMELIVFYYCLGPDNIFYPVADKQEGDTDELVAGKWLAEVNHQVFAVIFWFVLTGPVGLLLYRLVYLCKNHEGTQRAAEVLISWLDWATARVTLLLYMLTGNFQRGWQYYSRMFFTAPSNNRILLQEGGVLVARMGDKDEVNLSQAQHLVEHALIVFLVFIAIINLMSVLHTTG